MRIALFGPARVHRDDGTPVALGGARLRALLAALALRPGSAAGTGTLIAEIWDGEPPADAPGALQALVARLRRALGADAVVSDDGGYRLVAARDDVDLLRFERLVSDGGRALRAGDPGTAAGLLADGLALWTAPPLADLPARSGRVARARAMRDDAVRLRLAAELAIGHAGTVLPELAALCAEQPLNEALHALHLRALRDTGRTADALNAYGTLRAALADRLGTDPGPELRSLYGELLSGEGGSDAGGTRGALPGPATPGVGAPTGAPHGGGRPGGHDPRPGPAGPAPSGPGGNLRARLTSFVGREQDLEGIGGDLRDARLLTLTGPGGSGKTRLSQEAADRFGDRWPDGAWLAELAPVADGATVAEAVLNALGLRETVLHATADKSLGVRDDPARVLTDHCAARSLLIVLDNCEHVIAACAELAERLLVHCPGVTVLATSREPLGVPGESVRPVDPLPAGTALRLLADRGAAARPGFTPDQDPAACAEICRRLDGLPLAIELAAARLRSMTPRQIAERLDDRFRLLTAGSRTVLPRQQTLRAVVDWSWDLLEKPERAVLRRLSVFAGGCDLTAAEVVCAGDGVESRDVAVLLGALVDKSLVVADLGGAAARYRTLETIGEYAAARLAESGERDAVEARHGRYFREFARTGDPHLRAAGQLRHLELFEREHDNLRAALRRAVDRGDEPEGLQLALACMWFWLLRNYYTELRVWPKAVAGLGPDPFASDEPPVPLELTPLEVELPFPEGQLMEARRWIRTAPILAWEEAMDDLIDREDARMGQALLDAYPPHLPQSGSRAALVRPFAAFLTGDFEQMSGLVDELVDACRRHGRTWELAFALQLRAKAFGDMTTTDRDFMPDINESRELFDRVGDRWGTAETLSAQAEAVGIRGDWQEAARCCREAMALAVELGAQQRVPELKVRLGEAVLHGGDQAGGERLLREAIDDATRLGPSAGGSRIHGRMNLVALLGHQGRLDEAEELVEKMMREPTGAVPQLLVQGVLLCMRGWLAAQRGESAGALEMARTGLRHLYEHRMADVLVPRIGTIMIPVATSLLCRVAEREPAPPGPRTRERLLCVARMLGANDHLRLGVTTPLEREELVYAERLCRELLGDAEFEEAGAAGLTLTAENAAAEVRAALEP